MGRERPHSDTTECITNGAQDSQIHVFFEVPLRKPSVPDPALPMLACDLKRSWQAGGHSRFEKARVLG